MRSKENAFDLGLKKYNEEKYDEAIVILSKEIKQCPKSSEAYNVRGACYDKLNRDAEALRDYSQSIVLDPKSSLPYVNRGVMYYESGELDKAKDDLTQAVKLGCDNSIVYMKRGNIYLRLGNFNKALKDFNLLIQSNNGQQAFVHNWCGLAYKGLGNPDAAMTAFNKALEIERDSVYLQNRGMLFMALGKPTEALQDFDEAVRLYPKGGFAYLHRGMAYHDLGREQEARRDFSQLYTSQIILCVHNAFYYINDQSFNLGETGLHIAVRYQDNKLADKLLQNGIDQSIKNRKGLTAIEEACQAGYGKMVEILVSDRKKKEKKPLTNIYYESALILAIRNGHYANLVELLSVNTSCEGFDPDEKGNIAIYESLAKDNAKILGLLLTILDIKQIKCNRHGDSIFEMAQKNGANSCFKYLLQRQMLMELQAELPKFSWLGFLPPGLADIDSELQDLKLDDYNKVSAVFVSIQGLLYEKPAGIGGDIYVFYEKFQKKLAVVNQQLYSIASPAPYTVYTGQSSCNTIFSATEAGQYWFPIQQNLPQEYSAQPRQQPPMYQTVLRPSPTAFLHSEPVYHNGQRQTFFQMASEFNLQRQGTDYTVSVLK